MTDQERVEQDLAYKKLEQDIEKSVTRGTLFFKSKDEAVFEKGPYYHYTTYHFFKKIIKTGKLRFALAKLNYDASIIPCLYLTVNPNWDNGASGMVPTKFKDGSHGSIYMGRDEFFKYGFYPMRIGVAPGDIKYLYSYDLHQQLYFPGISDYDPIDWRGEKVRYYYKRDRSEWRVCYHEIPLSAFDNKIDIWTGEEWKNIDSPDGKEFLRNVKPIEGDRLRIPLEFKGVAICEE